MSSRNSRNLRVRTKVVALLVSLVALWGFAAYVTVQAGLNLLWVSTLDQKIGRPTDALISALQQERRMSVVLLGNGSATARTALDQQRVQTDAAAAHLRESVAGMDAQWAESDETAQRVNDLLGQLDGLGASRKAVDTRAVDRAQTAATITDIISAGFRIYNSLSSLDDQDIAKNGRTIIALNRAREVLAQEDALIAGAFAAGRFSGNEPDVLTQLVGAQRFLFTEAVAELPESDQARYRKLTSSPTFTHFQDTENLILERARAGAALPVSNDAWQATVEPVFAGLADLVVKGTDDTVARATPVALGVIVRLLLAGGLGLLAVITSIIISITTARSLVRELEKLRAAAWDLATQRLPNVVDRLRHGDEVNIEAEAPPLSFGSGEIGQVGDAFNAVQETAIRVAVEQAELRRGVRDVFLSLARRTQALVHRQLRLLDTMERRENSSDELEDLFRVDHLATRMRRNAENLIVLSGAVPGRGWRRPVPFVDVVRGALAEVEDYTRVTISPIGSSALAGRAVGDVIHLLAEIIENAVSFSPPYTIVQVSGQRVANGFAVEIEDRGLGMSETDLAAANDLIRNPPEFSMTSTVRLGLYVVSRLAERHGIRVSLKDSPYGGTTAVVLVPLGLVIDGPDSEHARVPASSRIPIGAGSEPDTTDTSDVPEPGAPAGSRPPAGAPNGHLVPAGPRHRQEPDGHLAAPVPRQRTEFDALAPLPARTETVPTPEAPTARASTTVEGNGATAGATAQDEIPIAPSGLPLRTRQASLAAPLRDDDPPADDSDGLGAIRPPDEIRRMMSSYQSATLRARSEVDQVIQEDEPNQADEFDPFEASLPTVPTPPPPAANPAAPAPDAANPANPAIPATANPDAATPDVQPDPPAVERPSRVIAIVPVPGSTAVDFPVDHPTGDQARTDAPVAPESLRESAPGPTDPAPTDRDWPPSQPWSAPGNGVHSADPGSHP